MTYIQCAFHARSTGAGSQIKKKARKGWAFTFLLSLSVAVLETDRAQRSSDHCTSKRKREIA